MLHACTPRLHSSLLKAHAERDASLARLSFIFNWVITLDLETSRRLNAQPATLRSTIQRTQRILVNKQIAGRAYVKTKRPVRNRPAKAKRAQPTRRHSFRKARLRVHGHPERPRRRDRRQVRVQPGCVARSRRSSKPDTSGTYPRSCALTGMIPAKSGPAATDARPAAAAAASRWPMFDFREVHTVGARIARLAAPTCGE